MLAAGELAKVGFGEWLCVAHDGFLSFLVGFGVQQLLHPWPSPRTGVCKGQAGSQGPGTQRDLRDARRREIASAVMGGSRLPRAEGKSPLSSASGSEGRCVRGRYPRPP
jgi:hypothetical protein